MTRTRTYVFAIATLLLAALCTASTGSHRADRIIKKYRKAVGGSRLEDIRTIRMSGHVTISGFDAPFTMVVKKPDRSRMELTIAGKTIVQAYDGDKAWWINPFAGAETAEHMPDDFARQLARWSTLESPLLNHRRERHRIDYLGKSEDGTLILQVRTRDEDVIDVHVDGDTYLEKKRSFDQTYRGKTRRSDTFFADYEKIEGVMAPRRIRGVDVRGEPYTMSVDSYEFDTVIDDDVFVMPATSEEQSDEGSIIRLKEFELLLGAFNADRGFVRSVTILSPT